MSNETSDWRQQLSMPTRRLIAWASDNPNRMLMTSNESGKTRVYTWDRANNRQVLLPPEAKAGYTWLNPQGSLIYYVQDIHDSEIGHLMRVAWDGGEPEAIAPNLPPMYYYGLQIARDGTLYFAGSGQGSYRIYRLDRNGAHVLYEHQNEAYLPFLSADERLLAFCTSEPANNRHWQATVVDAHTGARVAQLSDGDAYAVNPGRFLMASIDLRPWSPVPGDARLLFTSNVSGEPKPGIWDVRSGARFDLAQDLPGEVTPLGWMPDASAVILQQTYNGRTWIYSFALERFEPVAGETTRLDQMSPTSLEHVTQPAQLTRLPHAPGTLSPLPVFPDGTLWYTYTSMAEPAQTRALNIKEGQESIVLPPTSAGSEQRWEPARYQSSDGTMVHGFVGIPAGSGPFPAILHMHGGPTGQVTDMYMPTWQHLVEQGYLFFTINFRGSTGYGRAFQEQINGNPGHWELEDMAAARAFLIERNMALPDKIMLTGGSYGGYLTLMGLTRQPDLWCAGFATVPLCNFALMYEDANQRLKGWARTLLGGTPEERPEQYWHCSPIAQVEHLRAPVAIIAHRSDTRCPIRQVEQFIQRLEQQGAPYEATITEGGHGTRSVEEMIQQHELLVTFAARHLKGERQPHPA